MTDTNIIEHKNTQQMMLDSSAVEQYKDIAQLMAKSSMSIPDHLRGKPADCLAVVFQAAQWRMNPFNVAQKTFFINGSIGYEAQLINSVVSSSNVITGRFKYEYKGSREEWKPKWVKQSRNGKDHWKPEFNQNACVRVGAVLTGESDVTWGEWIYPADQTIFNSPLWRTNPKQQAGYLAVKFWARFYTPDVIMGAYTPDELVTKDVGIKDINPVEQKRSPLMQKLAGEDKAQEPEVIEEPNGDSMAYDDWEFFIDDTSESKVIAAEMPRILGDNRITEDEKKRLTDLAANKIAKIKEQQRGE